MFRPRSERKRHASRRAPRPQLSGGGDAQGRNESGSFRAARPGGTRAPQTATSVTAWGGSKAGASVASDCGLSFGMSPGKRLPGTPGVPPDETSWQGREGGKPSRSNQRRRRTTAGLEPRVGESSRLDVLKGPRSSRGEPLLCGCFRTGALHGGSEVFDSEGEGKSMRDGRAGFTIVIPFKAVAGRRQEPARTPCSWRG